jgi:hypothetical protein
VNEDRPTKLTDDQRAELARRDAELDAHPEIALTWEQVRSEIETASKTLTVRAERIQDEDYVALAGWLDQAAAEIGALRDVNLYCPFSTPAEFASRVRELADRVRLRDRTALRELVPIFAPTGAWDDSLGSSGMDLANRIDELLDRLRWNAT